MNCKPLHITERRANPVKKAKTVSMKKEGKGERGFGWATPGSI
jgi:hypothetical protein